MEKRSRPYTEEKKEEERIVNAEFLGRKDVYNLAIGGTGNWQYTNSNKQLIKDRNKKCTELFIAKLNSDPEFKAKAQQYGGQQGQPAGGTPVEPATAAPTQAPAGGM